MPRPLPAHLASAMLLWLSSRVALTTLPSGSLFSNAPGPPADVRLAALAAEIARLGPEAVAAALERQLRDRAEGFIAGLEAYRRHPFQRHEEGPRCDGAAARHGCWISEKIPPRRRCC
jgi:polyhydroxyalkanoate synthase